MNDILLYTTDVAMSVLKNQVHQTIRERMTPGQELHRAIFNLYGSVTSEPSFDLQQFLSWICDLVQLFVKSSQLTDIRTATLQYLAVELISLSRYKTAKISSTISATVEKIDIKTVIKKFSDFIVDRINEFNQKTNTINTSYTRYSCDDTEMLESTNEVLTFEWCDIIRSLVQRRVTQSLMYDLQRRTTKSSIRKLSFLPRRIIERIGQLGSNIFKSNAITF